MYRYTCLNPIAQVGLDEIRDGIVKTEDINEADAILVRSAKMHDLEVSEKLLAVARAGAGVNNIPCDEYAKKGIVVFNTPGANANGVKELVIAGMLLASRDIIGGVAWTQTQADNPDVEKLAEKEKKRFAGCEIKGKKLGIIGLGAIGQRVANAAEHLGMDVYGYDPFISVDAAWNMSRNVRHIQDVKDLYAECDYITIHVPALESTKDMINAEAISQMKPGVVVLNFARNTLVDEPAMVEALKEGRVGKYVTDFANPVVLGAPNVIVTPHLGASTAEAEDNCAVMAVRELNDYLLDGNITNSVNYPRCDLGVCKTEGRIAVHHTNKANMISTFTGIIGGEGLNIENLTDVSRGEVAYSLMDIDGPVTDAVIEKLAAIPGVFRVRKVK